MRSRPARSQTVIAIFPRALPASKWRMASGTWSSGKIRSILGVSLPGLDEFGEPFQVAAALLGDEECQPLAYEQ